MYGNIVTLQIYFKKIRRLPTKGKRRRCFYILFQQKLVKKHRISWFRRHGRYIFRYRVLLAKVENLF